MPSRRSPVAMAWARISKSSATSTRMVPTMPHAGGVSQVSAAGTVLTPARPRRTIRMIEVSELRKRFGPALALDGMTFTVTPRPGHRLRRPERRGQVHHDAGHPRPGPPRRGHRPDRRPPYRSLEHPLRHVGVAARRRRRCSRAARRATTCAGWPTPRACPRAESDEVLELTGLAASRRSRRPAATPSACASGSASPPPCSATRRC